MKKFLFIIYLLPNICFGQSESHIISGINLNDDWYMLTNQSALSYYSQLNYCNENDIDGVTMSIDESYLKDKVNDDFLNIEFTDLTLVFPKGEVSSLDKLQPYMFMASLKYSSDSEFRVLSEKEFSNIASILMNQFGPPNNSMKESWGASFQWELDNAQLALSSSKTDHIVILYLKK